MFAGSLGAHYIDRLEMHIKKLDLVICMSSVSLGEAWDIRGFNDQLV